MSEERKSKKVAVWTLLALLAVTAVVGVILGIIKDNRPASVEDDGLYSITILKSAHGTVTANKTEAKEGEEIILTVTPDEGYELKSLTVNKKESETTFQMPAEDVNVLAKFVLIDGEEEFEGGEFFGKSGDFLPSDVIDFTTDSGDNPYLVLDASKGTPLYTYISEFSGKKFFFETDVEVTGILKDEKYPKFGLMTNDGTEMVKFYLDMNTKKQVSGVGTVHQAAGKEDDWANQDYFTLEDKLSLSKKTVKLGFLRNGSTYYFYVNGELVATGSDISNKETAAGVFSFGTSLKLTNYKLITDSSTLNKLYSNAKADLKKFNKFTLTTNYFKEKDGVYTLKTNSEDESKVDDVKSGGKVLKTSYYSVKGKLILKNAKDWSQSRILVSADPKHEYVIALERVAKNKYQIFTMSKNNEDTWNNWTSIVSAEVNGNRNSIDFEVIADGQKIYFLIDDVICYVANSVNFKESTVKFSGYKNATTVLEDLDGDVFEKQADVQKYLETKDAESFYKFSLTTNYFKEEKGVYTLNTKTDDEGKVDDVVYAGNSMKAANYSVKGKLTLSNAKDWSQSRILISSDAKNEHVIALEQTGKDAYQIFAMSKADETTWNDWRLISSSELNGNKNSINFEVVAIGKQIYFLVDDEICYVSNRVAMTESTVKFASYKKATTTVENLDGQIFADKKAATDYLTTKNEAAYKTAFESRINELYKEYITDQKCGDKDGTVILGHSHVDAGFWGAWEAQTGLTKYVNGYNVGIGGSTTKDWLYAYDKLVKSFGGADRFVISLGENDVTVWGEDGEDVVARLEQLFEKIHADFPNAEICYIYSLPSPTKYVDGAYTNEKYTALVKGEKELCKSLDYVTAIDTSKVLMAADKKNVNADLFREDKLHLNEAGYNVWSDYLYDVIFKGDTFGVTVGDNVSYKTTNGIELIHDNGAKATVDIFGKAPRYAYVNNTYANKFYFETEVELKDLLEDDYPKFGLLVNGKTEMVKFYLDVNKDSKEVARIGVVHQPTGKDDDWANQKVKVLDETLDLGKDKVTLGLLRDGKTYYFYVNGKLVVTGEELTNEKGAAGVFSFNSVMTLQNYKVVKAGEAYDKLLVQAQKDAEDLYAFKLTTNFFTEAGNGVYTLTTDSDNEGTVDDVKRAGSVVREAYYSIKGKITLDTTENWTQARILISSDPNNEHIIAMERVDGTNYQIFAMSKAGETLWNDWRLVSRAELNGNKNSIDFEVVVNGDEVYFLMDDAICYTSDRVSMTESTVKFAGYKNATTTVENLDGQIFENEQEVKDYLATKSEAAYETVFESRIDELYKEYITHNGCGDKDGTVILGHSHVDAGFWSAWEAQTGLTKYVNGFNVGIGGSTMKDWLYAYDKLIKSFGGADRFVISLGENDVTVWGEDGEDVVARLGQLFEKIHTDFPNAEIYYIYSLPSPTKFVNGAYTNAKYAALVEGEKALCESLDYVNGVDTFDVLATADKKNVKTELFREDNIHLNDAGYAVWSDYLYDEIFKGNTFGVTFGDGDVYKTTNGVELFADRGNEPTIEIFGTSPRYAYLNDTYTKQFYFETEAELTNLLPDNYPKFGLIINGKTESVKFYLDVNKGNKQVAKVGVVHQPTGGADDWVGQKVQDLETPLELNSNKVKLGLLRDGKNYYFYVNDKLVMTGEDFADENGAVGAFTFNSVVTLGKFELVKGGQEYDTLLEKAKEDAEVFEGFKLTTNHFEETAKNVFAVTTNSGNEGIVDDLTYQGKVVRKGYYSVKGKLTLTNAGDWGQSRILISSDASNEYMIALERTNQDKYQIFAVSKSNENGWNWDTREWICDGTVKTYGNSIDFEVVADGKKVYFLINDAICFASERVSMTESTVKFAGINQATTTVENLDGTFFESSGEVQTYLATKSGQNFGKTVGDHVTYQTAAGTSLEHDYGNDASIKFVGSGVLNAYLKDTYENKFYFETEINVQSVHDGENYPKFGILLHGQDEQLNFYVDMSKDTLTSNTVGVVRNYDWNNIITTNVSGMNFTGNSKVKLAIIRDGANYFFYVNDQMVFHKVNAFSSENSAIGLFSFNTVLTASSYHILKGNAADVKIAEARQVLRFFDKAADDNLVDLSNDLGSNVGTASVKCDDNRFVYVKDFNHSDYYFETKVHVKDVRSGENWPKFGIFAEGEAARELFYVDMRTDKTANVVGRMTATNNGTGWNDNWGGATSVNVEGMSFAGDGEFVTLGVTKEGNRFLIYVNGEYAFYYDSTLSGATKVGVFSFGTGMELKEYFVNKEEGIDTLLTLKTEGSFDTVELGKKIWTDKDYEFYEMPSAFIGETYISNVMKSEITFDVHKDGYVYVLTPYRGHSNSVADLLDYQLYDRIETPAWYLANYTKKVDYWAYERRIVAGETVTIHGSSKWHMVIVSELPIDPTVHEFENYVFSDGQLAILEPTTESGGTVISVDVRSDVYPFSDREASASNPAKLQNVPYYLKDKSLIKEKLNDNVKANVVNAGKVLLIGSTSDERKTYFTQTMGFTFVEDMKTTYGNILSASSYNTKGYGLYAKDVTQGEVVDWNKNSWFITMFQSTTQLPPEPPVSIEITQMPTKTTYKLGEDFDPTGLVVKGTDKYGNERVLDASEYVTVPTTFTANAYAASVIVDEMLAAIPVTITDASGNPLEDNTAYSESYYTTQKAPVLNGSVKRSTVAEVISAIRKMEADGATAFNVHLTELSAEYQNKESFRQIAECTEYPVMAIAYGSEDTRVKRITMMKEAVEAGFDIVDLRMDTFDDESRASLAGTVFETSNPKEVSMKADVIEQQKALVQEFKNLGAEVLMSAHVGVFLNEEEGVALAKEMEARGADVAKIVLGSAANDHQQEVMQTNQTLQNEVDIKFYFNAQGNASRPYRTASTLLGTHMVFCYAEYHSSNVQVYDYIKDLKEFYKDIPGLDALDSMLEVNNSEKIDIVKIGRKIWTTRDYVFTNMPKAFIGKEFVKASYGTSGQTVDVTVKKPGYIYVLTNAYKTSNSQAETLDALNYTKVDVANWKFCDFTGSTSYIWVYEKYVEPGETLQLAQWSVVIASEDRIDLVNEADYTVPDAQMAILKPLDNGASVGNMELNAKAFANRSYKIEDTPYWLAGKNYILGDYGAGSAEVTRSGFVYMLTNTGNSGKREAYFVDAGYTKINMPEFNAITESDFVNYDFVLYGKNVNEGDTVTWPSWAIPIFSGDLALSENLAVLAPGTDTTVSKFGYQERLFNDRSFYEDGGAPEALYGKSYLYGAIDNEGSQTATGTVTKAGTVYIQIPVKTDNNTYKALLEQVEADGFTPAPYRIYRNSRKLGYSQRLYQKEVTVGDTIHYGKYNLVFFETLANEEDYYVMPSLTTAAEIYNNPKTNVNAPKDAIYTYDPSERNWQGCPVMTITDGPSGKRIWAGWFTGGRDELATGNFAVLLYSDDNGETWVDPAVAIVHPDSAVQVTKPQVWTMDDGRLWVSWTQHTGTGNFDGKMGTWAAICENPGAPLEELRWSEPRRLFDGRGNGKITIINKGTQNEEWLTTAFDWMDRDYSKVYSSTDKGATWTFKGMAEVTGSTYNNAILVDRSATKDGSYLWMVLRQLDGNMKESFSYDGGVTWTNSTVSSIAHPNSAIYMGWTSSGKLLMINHKDFNGRNNLTAFLSEDGGQTWPYTLLLDERLGVSYPDVVEDSDGTFYVVYDYDRFKTGQMYMATITEEDIIAGKFQSSSARQKVRFALLGEDGAVVSDDLEKIDLSNKEAWAFSVAGVEASAEKAFDGDDSTRYCASSVSLPQQLMVDLGEVQNIGAIYMFFEQVSGWSYKLETSLNGTEWTEYATANNKHLLTVTETKDATARYVRLTVTGTTESVRNGKAWASLWEMEIYAHK